MKIIVNKVTNRSYSINHIVIKILGGCIIIVTVVTFGITSVGAKILESLTQVKNTE